MNIDEKRRRVNEVAEAVIGCAFRVSNTLGCGFLEKVYENALGIDLRRSGLSVLQQRPIDVWYEGEVVGEYVADLVVEGCVIVELKACAALDAVHVAQCINYLRATGLAVCLLINFGKPRIEIKRLVN